MSLYVSITLDMRRYNLKKLTPVDILFPSVLSCPVLVINDDIISVHKVHKKALQYFYKYIGDTHCILFLERSKVHLFLDYICYKLIYT